MKKLLIAAVAVVLMSTSAFALSYAVNVDVAYVTKTANGSLVVGINNGTTIFQKVIPAAEKEMAAMALTAISAGMKTTFIIDGNNIQKMKLIAK